MRSWNIRIEEEEWKRGLSSPSNLMEAEDMFDESMENTESYVLRAPRTLHG